MPIASEASPRRPGRSSGYFSTLRKWERWGGGIPIQQLARKDVREFLDWVYDQAVTGEGGLTAR
jgi:hypothetical protein